MKDFNFFEPYLFKSRKMNTKRLVTFVFSSILSFIIVIYPLIKSSEIKKLQEEIYAINQAIESPDRISKFRIIEANRMQLNKLKGELEFFKKLQTKMLKEDKISHTLIQSIIEDVPKGIYFDTLTIKDDYIEIQSIATYKASIAQMERNLRNNIAFEEIFISSIIDNNGYYAFTITFKVKDVTDSD